DLRTAGITLRPLAQMTGESGFNQMFFDNVRVPRENLVGELNRGWYIAQDTLGFERGPVTLSYYIGMRQDLDEMLKLARTLALDGAPAIAHAALRQRLATSYIDLEILRLNGYRMLSEMIRGKLPGADASPPKIHWGQTGRRLYDLASDLLATQS